MTSLSLILPEVLAKESQAVAENLGISRTQFIRLAIIHELENYRAQVEQKNMAKSMLAMKKNSSYLKRSNEIIETLNIDLPKEKELWWNKKRKKKNKKKS